MIWEKKRLWILEKPDTHICKKKNDVLMVAEKREVYGDMETKIVKD